MTTEVGSSAGIAKLRWVLPVAAAVGLALAWLAPADWSAGAGALEVGYLQAPEVLIPVEFGATNPVSETIEFGSATIEVLILDGLGTGDRIDVALKIKDSVRSPSLDDVAIALVTPSGSREIVPVSQAGPETFTASRRPVNGSAVVLGLLGVAMVLWLTEAVPLFVTSLLIPVVLAISGVGTAAESLAPFFDPIIVLFFAGFLMAEGMRRSGLDRLVAVTIVDLAGGGPVRLYATLLFLAAFMSMWMSNTAAVTVLLPIAMAVTEPLDSHGYRKVVVLGIAYAATIGGVGSAIGTPANPMVISFVERFTGRELSFVDWFGFGLPMVALFLPLMATYLWVVGGVKPPVERFRHAAEVAHEHRSSAGPLTRAQLEVVAVFGAVVILWLTQGWHGQNTGIIALAGAVGLFFMGRIESEDLSRISWPTLLTFGGGLTLGTFMVTTGTSDWLVTRLSGVSGWPEIVAVSAVAIFALGLTTVASNTAAAATLIPLAIPLAGIIGVEPVLLAAVVAIATSIDFALVIGTPPTMLAYSTELFSVREILAKGAVLDVVGIALLVLVVVPVWRLFGLV